MGPPVNHEQYETLISRDSGKSCVGHGTGGAHRRDANLLLFGGRQVAQAARAQAPKDDGDGQHGEQQRRVGASHKHAAPEVKALGVARERYDGLVGGQAQHGGAGQVECVGLPPRSQLLSAHG